MLLQNPYQNYSNFGSAGTVAAPKRANIQTDFRQKSRQPVDPIIQTHNNGYLTVQNKNAHGGQIPIDSKLSLASALSRPSTKQTMLTLTQEEREKLQNPTQVMSRIHQYVVNNKESLI